MLRMDIVTERRIKMTYKEFEMQVKTYLEENLGADVTVSTYTARKNKPSAKVFSLKTPPMESVSQHPRLSIWMISIATCVMDHLLKR